MEHTAALLGHAPQLLTMPPDAAKDSDPVTRVHWSSAPGAGKMTSLWVRKTNKRVTTWKAKCPIFKAIVAGFRGKVA